MGRDGRNHGLGYCPRCRAELVRDSNFCNRCGQRLAPDRTVAFGSRAASANPVQTPAPLVPVAHNRPSPAPTSWVPPGAPMRVTKQGREFSLRGLMLPLVAAGVSFGVGVAVTAVSRGEAPAPTGHMGAMRGEEEIYAVPGVKLSRSSGVTGIQVEVAEPETDLAAAGIRRGDTILGVDGAQVTDLDSFLGPMRTTGADRPVRVEYVRDGNRSITTLVPDPAAWR